MDYFDHEGSWWLPENPSFRIQGQLTFDSSGVALRTDGSLVATVSKPGAVLEQGPPEWETTPIIHGQLRNRKRITLFESQGANFIGPHSRGTYFPRLAVVGDHYATDTFLEMWCEFDCLTNWAELPPLAERQSDGSGRFSVRFSNLPLHEVSIGNSKLGLTAYIRGDIGGNSVHVDQAAAFTVSFEEGVSSRDLLNNWIRPLQDFLIIALGRPVRLTNYWLKSTLDPRSEFSEGYFSAVQPAAGPIPGITELLSYTAPTLFSRTDSPVSIDVLLSSWFNVRKKYSDVVTLLHGPFYASFMFAEHRYAAIFQSAEALMKNLGESNRELPKSAHRIRVQAVINAALAAGVDEETVGWASRVLASRNDRTLAQQIDELVRSIGEPGQRILEANPEFARQATSLRTGVSHGGASEEMDALRARSFEEALRWVVRTRLLMEIGFQGDYLEAKVISRGGFTHMLDGLRAATEMGIREQSQSVDE